MMSSPPQRSNMPLSYRVPVHIQTTIDTWIVETAHHGNLAEPPGIVEPFIQEIHNWFGTPVRAERYPNPSALP